MASLMFKGRARQVVARRDFTVPVSSDNAMIDSGERTLVIVMPEGVPAPYQGFCLELADTGLPGRGYLGLENQERAHSTLLALADRMEELGDPDAPHVRAHAAYYAAPEYRYERLYQDT